MSQGCQWALSHPVQEQCWSGSLVERKTLLSHGDKSMSKALVWVESCPHKDPSAFLSPYLGVHLDWKIHDCHHQILKQSVI
jgi:hypothetical protein